MSEPAANQMIDSEIAWCETHEEDTTPEFRKGFISGLRQAKYLIRIADTADEDTLDEPINEWFELSYAQYLTVPRLVMQSMPLKWQYRMAALLQEMDETFNWRPKQGRYWVQLRDAHGHFSQDPLWNYRHGNIEHLRIPKEEKE
jgi:hypothetical protein